MSNYWLDKEEVKKRMDADWEHAACLTIAETGQKWGDSIEPSLAMQAVYDLYQKWQKATKELEELRQRLELDAPRPLIGSQEMDAGYFYAPYVPMYSNVDVLDLSDYVSPENLNKYGEKVWDTTLYGRVEIQCDETLNTPDVVARNELKARIEIR